MMNDDEIEKLLRSLPNSSLPEAWRVEILGVASREARPQITSPQNRLPLLIFLRRLFARNPITSGALTTLWLLILLFKSTTPVDPAEKEMLAHFDPTRPVYLVSLHDEIKLAELWEDQPPSPQLQ